MPDSGHSGRREEPFERHTTRKGYIWRPTGNAPPFTDPPDMVDKAEFGDFAIAPDDSFWFYDGTTWNQVAIGPTGAVGPTGPQGDTGPTGPQGDQGDVGPMGALGVTGDTGREGWMGPPGLPGRKGDMGPPGLDGRQGRTGREGQPGVQGPQGVVGAVGPVGTDGLRGAEGSMGVPGQRGISGPQGSLGPQGIDGRPGHDATGISEQPGFTTPVGHPLHVGYMDMIALAANPPAPPAGRVRFHASTNQGFTRFEQDNEAATNVILGRDSVFIVRNTSGAPIAARSPVYVTSSTGNVPNVALAKADAIATLPAIGITLDTIADSAFGQVMKLGIISNINTALFSSGDVLWVSKDTAGALVNIRPVSPNLAQIIGSVLVSGVGNGSILVNTTPFIGGEESGTTATPWRAAGVVNAITGYLVNGAAASGEYLRGNGTNFVSSAILTADIAHNLLSATHSDTLLGSVVAGDLIYGNSTPKWARLGISVPAANVLNVIGVANGETVPSWKSIFDSTNPQAIVDAGGPGVSLLAAHLDHAHSGAAYVALSRGVEQDIADGITMASYLRVGSATTPTNTTAGDITGVRLHLGTDGAFTTGFSLELVAARQAFTGSYTLTSTLDGVLGCSPTITNNTGTFIGALIVRPTLNGNGDTPLGVNFAPTFAPSASVTAAYGGLMAAFASPATTKTITTLAGFASALIYNNVAGAVTSGYMFWANAPTVSGALKPGTQVGVQVENQGATGITTAIGVRIVKPTNATNNFYFGFDVADATAAGTYHGRIPVLYNNLLKYIHIFNA